MFRIGSHRIQKSIKFIKQSCVFLCIDEVIFRLQAAQIVRCMGCGFRGSDDDENDDDGDDAYGWRTHKNCLTSSEEFTKHARWLMGFKPTTKTLRSLTQNVNLQLRMWLWMWISNGGQLAGQHRRHNLQHVAAVPVAVAFALARKQRGKQKVQANKLIINIST